MANITILGAGSGTFALNMIRDICLTPNLHGSRVCFMDIDEKRLNASHSMCVRLAKEFGCELELTKTTSREEALTGAEYIINTILINGYKGMTEGWQIAEKHGYRRGGSLHILHDEAFWINFHQLRMMEDILLDIKRICPEAWYLVVANPVLAGTTYLRRKYPEVKMVGLCHGTGMIRRILPQLGLEHDDVTYQIPGVNHFVWMNEFYHKGKDAFPIIDKWIEEKSEEYFAQCKMSDYMGRKPVDLYKRYGVFPIGDTANPGGGAWGYGYHSDKDVEKSWGEDPYEWFDGYFERSATRLAIIEKAAYDESASIKELVDCTKSHEPMIPIIESLSCGVEHVLVINVLNDREYVPGIPKDFEVEVPALCGAHGISPMATKPLPKPIIALALRDRVAPVEMELAAYENHDKQLLIDLVMMDPRSTSRKQAEALVDEILELPYHQDMKAWYK